MFIAVEWTSKDFRSFLIHPDGSVADTRETPDGAKGLKGAAFEETLRTVLADWLSPARLVLISGMATSRTGWMESPLAMTPAGPGDLAREAVFHPLDGTKGVVLLPGVASAGALPDVMRSEEIRILGTSMPPRAVAILPGAHTKWVMVDSGRIGTFWTFMTGEMTELLLRDSILSSLVPKKSILSDEAFALGMRTAADTQLSGGVLRRLFSTRTLTLSGRLEPEHIPSYLQGLALAAEAREALAGLADADSPFIILGRSEIAHAYQTVLQHLGCPDITLADCNLATGFFEVRRHLGDVGEIAPRRTQAPL